MVGGDRGQRARRRAAARAAPERSRGRRRCAAARRRVRPGRAGGPGGLHVAAYSDRLAPGAVGASPGARELVDEPGRLLAVVLGRLDRPRPLAGAGASDVEQPRSSASRAAPSWAAAARRRRSVGVEQRRASAQVRPALLLDVGDHHEPPLEALGPVGGEQPDRVAAHASLGERVAGDLLGPQRRQEVAHAGVAALLLARAATSKSAQMASRSQVRAGRRGRPGRPAAQPKAASRSPTTGARAPPRPSHLRRAAPAAPQQEAGAPALAWRRARGCMRPFEQLRVQQRLAQQDRRRARDPVLRLLGEVLLAGPQRRRARAPRWRRARRRETRVAPRPRPGPEMVGVGGVLDGEVDDRAQGVEQRQRRPGSLTSGGSSAATSTGTPAAPSARRSGGIDVRPERTRTAIWDQGTPSSRCARRSRSATCSVSARSVSKVSTSARPAPNSGLRPWVAGTP